MTGKPARLRRARSASVRQLDADDREAALEQRPRRLAGRAADLEQPRAGLEPGERDQVVEQLRRILGPRRVVELGGGLERLPQRLAPVLLGSEGDFDTWGG